jgi:GAF domain-containing protein
VSRYFPLLLWLLAIGSLAIFGGIRNSGFPSLAIVILIASLTLGTRAGLLYASMTVLAGTILVIAENRGMLPVYIDEPNTTILISYSLTILSIGLLSVLAFDTFNKVVKSSLSAEKDAKDANKSLEQKYQDVEQRTMYLEQRSVTLQLVKEIIEFASHTKIETEFLNQTVQALARGINVNHVGIFFVDELEENAVLCTTNSLEGNDLLAHGYSLKLTTNTLAYTSHESGFIKFQSADSILYFTRPDSLPDTKSNISLPITAGEKIIGLINFQFNSPNPLLIYEGDLQVIANQIALSLENIRLLGQLQRKLHEISHLAGETAQTVWKQIASGEPLGFQYDQLQIVPKSEIFPDEVHSALSNRRSASYRTSGEPSSTRLVAPIILRDQVMGVIGYEDSDANHNWLPTEINMLETIASRVSLALENSRLVAEAEQRASRERVLGQITSRIRETLDFDTILQTALQELHQSFDLHEAEIRLQAIKPGSTTS